MAYFKLSLLDFAEDSTLKNAGFISSTMSEFYSQREAHESGIASFCYTYNESLSLHTNAQKELTFSIDRMILRDNEWIENPFSRYMTIGTQLALEDSYHNQYFFIIKDVKYTFKAQNMTSAVTCQDAFTYQMSRQNDGYEITNDADSDDFIGAKDIDWWVTKKVIPECFVSYTYLKLNQGLYTKNGKAYVFDNNLDAIQDTTGIKIIKQPYNRIDYKDYYETFAFSGSGTANSVLISLGEQIGLMTQTFEHFNADNSFDKYFWFEPRQHEENNGLYYSPFSSIQSFSLSHGGSSLTTVLNVSGSSSDDEVVSLLPEVTPFISQSFTSSEWLNSKWHVNFFHDWVRERVVHYSSKEHSTDFRIWHTDSDVVDTIKNSYVIQEFPNGSDRLPHYKSSDDNSGQGYEIYLPISTDSSDNFLISSLYDNYSFITSAHTSEIVIKNKDGTLISLTPTNSSFSLCIKDQVEEWHFDDNVLNYTGLQAQNMWLKIYTLRTDISEGTIESEDIYFRWYREPTSSDIAFAEVADDIPWLENKLIDFSYFQRNSILSPEEVKNLTNLIHNNLRIANGKLIFYSKQYYAALHAKTKILADMENQFDVLGANFYSDIVSPYASDKIISTIDNFANAYNNIYSSLDVQQFDGLLNYTDTYSSYVNKYINSQQSFLKNIYNFVNYFNYPINLNNNMCLYEDKITIKDNSASSSSTTEQTVIFDDGQGAYQVISSAKDCYDTSKASDFYGKPKNEIYAFYKNSSSIIKPFIAYQNCPEWNNLYYINPAEDPDQGMQLIKNSRYDNKQTYYQKTYVYEITKEQYEKLQLATSTTSKFVYTDKKSDLADYTTNQEDDKYLLIGYPTRLAGVEKDIDSFQVEMDAGEEIKLTNLIKTGFRKLTDNEIKTLWVLRNGAYESEDYIRVKNKYNYQPIENFYPDPDYRFDWFNSAFYKEGDAAGKATSLSSFQQNYYKKIPLTSFYFRDHYWKTVVSEDKKTETYQITTSAGKSLSDYLNGEVDTNPWDEYCFYEIPILNSDNIGKYYLLDSAASAQKNASKAFYDWALNSIGTADYNQSQFFDDWDEDHAPIACSDLYARSKITNTYQAWVNSNIHKTIDISEDESALGKINLGLYTATISSDPNLVITAKNGRSVKLKQNDNICYPVFANKFGFSWGTIFGQRSGGIWNVNNVNLLHMLDTKKCYYKDKWLDPIKTTTKWEKLYKGNTYYAIPLFYEIDSDSQKKDIDFSSKNIYSDKEDFKWIENLKIEIKNIYNDGRQILDGRSLSAIVNWPFNQQKMPISIAWDSSGKVNSITIDHFSNIKSYGAASLANNLVFKARYTTEEWEAISDSYFNKPLINVYFIICKERDYVSVKPTEDDVVQGTTLYRLSDDSIVNPLDEPNCIDGLYVTKVFEDMDKLQPAKGSQFNLDYHYYDNDGNRYYTVPQLFQENGKNIEYRWNNKTTYTYKSLSKDTLNLTLKLKTILRTYKNMRLQHQFTWNNNDDTTWIVVGKKLKVVFSKSSGQTETIDAELISYNANKLITIQLDKQPSITTGMYEVKVDGETKESGNIPDFFTDTQVKVFVSESTKSFQQDFFTTSEKSGIVETKIQPNNDNGLISEISYYWSGQVLDELSSIRTMGNFWYKYHKDLDQPVLFNFAASIEAQLEEYWQSAYTASNYCEYFLPQYWQPTESGDTNYFSDHVLTIKDNRVTISSLFVPNVERYRNPEVVNSGEEYLLPKYVLKYHPSLSLSNVEDGEMFADTVFAHNDAMDNIKNEIEIDYKDFTATKTSAKVTYYYSNSGGMKHADLIKFLGIKSNQDFANYSGLYVMEIRWLRNHYSDYPLDGYEAAREEHNKIWQNIYSKYPAMMLESKYSNTDATDSKQLLMLAKNYFKDLSNPERSYSITLINDLNNCIGYRGQELKVGDSIRLRANEFYDGFDDITSSLNQLLFITDIKYTLRKDTDISLTVNAIKYQNKLIKRLAKLIQ